MQITYEPINYGICVICNSEDILGMNKLTYTEFISVTHIVCTSPYCRNICINLSKEVSSKVQNCDSSIQFNNPDIDNNMDWIPCELVNSDNKENNISTDISNYVHHNELSDVEINSVSNDVSDSISDSISDVSDSISDSMSDVSDSISDVSDSISDSISGVSNKNITLSQNVQLKQLEPNIDSTINIISELSTAQSSNTNTINTIDNSDNNSNIDDFYDELLSELKTIKNNKN